LFRLRLLGRAQPLNAGPDAADGGLVGLEALHRHHARQAVPDGHQAFRRPIGGVFGQFLLAAETIKGDSGCGGGLFCGAKRRDVVLFIDGESPHHHSPCATLCAVITWITRNCLKRKGILNRIDDGERGAMIGGVPQIMLGDSR
jgi:hypothetical protein